MRKFRLLSYGENGGLRVLLSAASTNFDQAPGLLVVVSALYRVSMPGLPALMSSCKARNPGYIGTTSHA